MTHLIRHWRLGHVIYESGAATFGKAVEEAVSLEIDLGGADLRHANLVNAELDGALLRHALFGNANLTGANMAEAIFDGSDFSDAVLLGACLCGASLRYCRFVGAFFGATDIAGCAIDRSIFSTLSSLLLNFPDAASMMDCEFRPDSGAADHLAIFSTPPVVILGLGPQVALLERQIISGTRILPAMPSSSEVLQERLLDLLEEHREGRAVKTV